MAGTLPDTGTCAATGLPVSWGDGMHPRGWRHETDGSLCRHELVRQPPPSAEARRIGVKALIDPGCAVWSKDRRDADDQALGGIVVEAEQLEDRETGEVVRWYTCVQSRRDTPHNRPVTVRKIAETELGELSVELPNTSTMWGLIARLAMAAAKGAEKSGPKMPWVVEYLRWAERLAALASGVAA